MTRASDPTASAVELRELSRLHEPEILRALGENPSTPLDLLLHLAVWVPGRVLRNSALHLHILALGARVFENASFDALDALLNHPDGAFLLPLAVDCPNPMASLAAMRSRRLSPDLLERLVHGASLHTLRALAREPTMPTHVLSELVRHPEKMVREKVALNPSLAIEDQRLLLGDPHVVYWSLLHNPNLDPTLASELLDHPDLEIRKGAAACPRLPAGDLLRCARHADPALREAAAGNPSLPAAVLVGLTADRVAAVRAEAASSPRLSPRILEILAADPDKDVRQAVATNPSTPPDVLALLAEDPEEEVRGGVASNPHAPIETLEALGQPPDPFLFALLENPALPGALAGALVRQVLAGEELGEHELTALLTSPVLPSGYVAEVLRRNGLDGNLTLPRSTPEPLLRELAASDKTRGMVARHTSAPPDLLLTLAWDRSPAVARAARAALRRRHLALDE
jgi:hypothetical protein